MMQQGTVMWFNAEKGYGFIEPLETGAPEIFVHFSGIRGKGYKSLAAGALVEFSTEQSDKGLVAVDVGPVETPAGIAP